MNKEVTGNRDFLDEILITAQKEADQIIAQAEKNAESRLQAAKKQEDSLFKEVEVQLKAEEETQIKRASQRINSEKRRRELHLRDRFMKEIQTKTRELMIAQTQEESYKMILANWVMEGALGLGVKQIVLNGRVREREIMTDKWLRSCEKSLRETYGHDVTLELSEESALLPAGVVISEKGGRLVYNNQIETRLLRKQSDLRKIIYSDLFEDKFNDK